jgi:PAS domain S-box-containing protein
VRGVGVVIGAERVSAASGNFPAGSGIVAEQVRTMDWHATPVGAVETWPGALRNAVNLMLASPESMYVVWGDALTFFFNDAYSPILGPRLEGALGAPLRELWPDAWDAVRPPIERAFAGESSRFENMPVAMARGGVPEDTWWTFSFSPIYLDDGSVGGAFCVTKEVTQTIVAQQRLAQENQRLIALFDKSPMFMAFLSGPEHRIELANPGYERLVGHRDVLGKCIRDALPEVVEQGFLPLLDQVYRTGQPYIGSEVMYDAPLATDPFSGRRQLDIVFQPVLGEDGTTAGVFVQGLDITPHMELQRSMREVEARNRQIIDSASDYAIVASDLEGRVTLWNAGAEHIFGWSEAEMLGHSVERIYTPEDVQAGRLRHNQQASIATGGVSGERWLQHKSGARFWANGSMTVLRDEQGAALGFVKVLGDRTEQQRAGMALAHSERRLGALVSASSQSLYAMSADWREMRPILGAGASAEILPAITGWREERVHPDDRGALEAAIALATGQRQPLRLEHRALLPDGSVRWVLMRAVPLLDDAGEVTEWFGTASDVTERRQAEEQLRQLTLTLEERVQARSAELQVAEERLRQSQKMEAVGQLTGSLAHDFNNLLTAISVGLELLELRIEQGRFDDIGRYLEMAQSSAARATALTQRLLAFSRRQTLAPTPVVAEEMVSGMLDILSRTLGPSISITTDLHAAPWAVLVDAPQLENALLNLCINARDAMPEGGPLAIGTTNVTLDDDAAAQLDIPPGDYVCLAVKDAGSGMAPAVIAKAFEPFFTTKPIGQGTGLGLSMIYGFTRQSGGQVRIDSAPGQGTTVHLYLPRFSGGTNDDAAQQVPVTSLADRTGNVGTVLVVEDEDAVRALVTEVLASSGFRVLQAPEGGRAIETLQSGESIDLLVTDVGLTGALNGRQVADAGRQVRPGLPVLFITGYAASAAVGAGQLEEGMEVLTKPFTAAELERRARALLSTEGAT